MGSSLSSGGKGFGSSLRESDYPTLLQGFINFLGIRFIPLSFNILSLRTPGSFYSKGPSQFKNSGNNTPVHRFLGGNKMHVGKRIEQIKWQAQPIDSPPFYRTKNMQKCDHIGKIGLVIAYKQHILLGQLLDMFAPFDFYSVK